MVKKLNFFLPKSEWRRVATGMVGILIYVLGMNLFVVPLGLYSGGIMGVSQLLRTFLSWLGLHFGTVDVAGAFYWMLNIPMLLLAYRIMNGVYLTKMLMGVTMMSLLLSAVPVPAQPFVEEPLTGCLLGGIICGYGVGVYLRAGCSGGGTEILGIYYSRKIQNFSLGKMNLLVNAVVYSICLVVFDPTVVIYSVISSVICNLMTDRGHSQNISVEAIIISKTGNKQIEQEIMQQLHRGITYWNANGGYTGEAVDVLYTVLSKYEVPTLRRIVREANPHAFMVVKEGLSVEGNFVKHLN